MDNEQKLMRLREIAAELDLIAADLSDPRIAHAAEALRIVQDEKQRERDSLSRELANGLGVAKLKT